ncbi:bifunctional peptidase and arginyl-hydroxylase JMJD5 [Chelonus insularis]|uniref:bifunctional peptidase and arginyl-hydroxylase JMJD5 n=1 Tax=Chelonus insularis TaxID=460826 RepID=UPI0015893131|nr:bifunctional peptidase and arginyl-hydroxylase JMJD5 [Chelonus insularis]XP_034951122.1 bifunctional peptidase and arginyl-hydroxylase JMJD5 [Chelonus insularis]XP_034951123.1 bifunctional peptidase and arginyl-hydroxylase JMJD5 [Chelonus insularis]XP_034951124.1 bifunctional peptidase and arginyl-hydroxylase JMJD5 [Chelonus insularis]XP_034951125.1 bifunctional peptidase and arginyl-hydroxylase JMJD5 [Chelonus insularis]XP_034951126.1 bifunctional peptidase and arginyl-hydroxylase JMJD5 [C
MSLAPLITKGFPWDDILNICNDQLHPEIKAHIVPLYKQLHKYLDKNEKPSKSWIECRLIRIDACLYRIWEDLNTGHWKNVPIQHRYSYTICSIVKSIVLEIYSDYDGIEKNEKIKEVAQQVDKGLLLGAPLENFPNLLTDIASRINEYLSHDVSKATETLFEDTGDRLPKELLQNCIWVKRYKTPSLETFHREVFALTPAILEGCMDHWRALTLWKDPNYLIKVAGTRTVPIEIGSSYTEEDWSQQLLTLKDFIQLHVKGTPEKVGYLAQHQLFEQIPDLKEDFSIPDYCCFGDNADNAPVDINAWFGPKGTISPLHCDPRDNLLCQVFGCKKIILYHPNDREYLYPYATRLLCNTAGVDPLNPDYEKFPKFKNAKGFMCYLEPGEMLYIPPGWWHHVVSLSPSFSISFWWN